MAAGRDMVARLILTLTDRATGGLRRLQSSLSGIASMARRLAGFGAIVGAFSFAAAIPAAAAFESKLRDIMITAGRTGGEVAGAVDELRGKLQGLALQFREGSQDLAGGLGVLIARGLDPARAEQYLQVLAEVRSASGATTEELAQLAVSFERIAKVEGLDQVRQAMAVALRGGQLGGAELRDMARYLPGTLAQMGALETRNMRAVQNSVAMFQVLRDGFGTMEEAAAGAQQLIGHLMSEHTVKKMKELGFDLQRIYLDARTRMQRGEDIDPVEAVIEALRRAARIDPKIFEIMPDQNSRQALLSMINGLDRYLEIRRQLREATPDTIAQAGANRREGLGADMREAQERLSQIADSVGRMAGQALPLINQGLAQVQAALALLEQHLPAAIAMLREWGAAILSVFGGAWQFMLSSLRSLRTGIEDMARMVERAIEAIAGVLGRFRQGLEFQPAPPPAPGEGQRRFQQRGRAGGFYGDDPAVQPQSAPAEQRGDWRGRIEIGLAPGLVLRRGETDTPGVSLGTDRGLMLRPV
jgi:hypothetical protein